MEIRNILSSIYKNDERIKTNTAKGHGENKKDKIEISDQARALQGSSESRDLSEIQKKIESGFYNTEEVISKVAEAVLKVIGK